MKNINWVQKLSSGKFWALLAALTVSGMVAFKVDAVTIESVTGVITAASACVAYILAEGAADANRKE